MIIKDILGHMTDYPDKKVIWVNMPFDHAHKRIQRLRADDDMEFGLRLNEEARLKGLRHGDIIFIKDEKIYAINIEEEPVLIVKAKSLEDMASLGYIIGNRHARLYRGENQLELVTPYEKTLEEMLLPIEEISLSKGHRKLLSKDDLMNILPQGAGEHHHEHEHE